MFGLKSATHDSEPVDTNGDDSDSGKLSAEAAPESAPCEGGVTQADDGRLFPGKAGPLGGNALFQGESDALITVPASANTLAGPVPNQLPMALPTRIRTNPPRCRVLVKRLARRQPTARKRWTPAGQAVIRESLL